ncbi:LysM peptidoglycan-binding domain-containing protein [Rhodococcus sp. ABRD24]|uniref:LysM peptidoglycan-binding domain-containing protein n=1 Tax=Rhodococcus sp. ABRD24 TaxID=2507582 RepID=UPI001040091E|nr:transglycosylase family protein [Rhodococcus sp. ABRD24]QBJ98237.1 LysM peptidoglycan-binding domain-containing protein [Rhodococcus sp. ABRD24]
MTNFTFKRALGAVVAAGSVVAIPLAISTGTASAAGHDWSGVAECESSGNWAANTGNGFYGGLQFTQSTWEAYGGSGSAHNASKAEQIRVAENVLEGQGVGAWPVCGQYLESGSTPGAVASVAQPVVESAPVVQQQVPEWAPTVSAGVGTYVVQLGDTLSQIAATHGVSLANLASQVSNPDLIFPGQALSV